MQELEARHVDSEAIAIRGRRGAATVELLMWIEIILVLVTWETSARNFWNDERQDGSSRESTTGRRAALTEHRHCFSSPPPLKRLSRHFPIMRMPLGFGNKLVGRILTFL